MRGGSKLFIIGGVGLGLVAVLLLVASMSGGGGKTDAQNNSSKGGKITVVQAARDIPAHNILQLDDLVEKEVNANTVPSDAVQSMADVLGKSYRVPLTATQTLATSQVELPGLRNDIAVGKRALALPVDEKSLFAGLIQDSDYVDVIFHARLNEVRLLPTNLAESPEDEAAYSFGKQNSGTQNEGDTSNQDQQQDTGSVSGTSSGPIMWVPPGLEVPQHPATGDPGSKMFIRDDISDAQQLEPVAKVMIQDVKVLRVIRPGESYGADGQPTEAPATEPGQTAGTNGYIVVEVTEAQAEVLTFMQDKRHEYQVIVRGKDDHDQVSTKGVTFQILATDNDYDLPLPSAVTVSNKKK
jgi:Flp pilus assembly protein CpaB